jgi:ArsR family transcriptional regulator
MKECIKVMKALADPGRVKIIKLLQRRVLCVCELREALGLAQSTVSKHLKTLEEAGLVRYSKDGTWVNYELALDSENEYAIEMLECLSHWLEEDDVVQELDRRLPMIRRENITT